MNLINYNESLLTLLASTIMRNKSSKSYYLPSNLQLYDLYKIEYLELLVSRLSPDDHNRDQQLNVFEEFKL